MALDVSFSTRYQNILSISKTLTLSGQEFVEAKSEAQQIEQQFLAAATTNEDYQALCDDYIEVRSSLQVSNDNDGED